MYAADLRAAEAIIRARRREAAQIAESSLLYQRFANLPPAWIPRPGCWLLCQLGNLLIMLGQKLQRFGLVQQPLGLSSTASSSR